MASLGKHTGQMASGTNPLLAALSTIYSFLQAIRQRARRGGGGGSLKRGVPLNFTQFPIQSARSRRLKNPPTHNYCDGFLMVSHCRPEVGSHVQQPEVGSSSQEGPQTIIKAHAASGS